MLFWNGSLLYVQDAIHITALYKMNFRYYTLQRANTYICSTSHTKCILEGVENLYQWNAYDCIQGCHNARFSCTCNDYVARQVSAMIVKHLYLVKEEDFYSPCI